LLDEPMSQLDPQAAIALAARLRGLADAGVCVVVTEHRIERIAAHADRIVRMDAGRIVADGPGEDERVPHVSATSRQLGEPLAELSGIAAGYPGRSVLTGAELTLAAGSVTALAGENGSGKSTLARVLCGLHAPERGSVRLAGEDVTARPIEQRFPRVAFVSQDPGRVLLRERVDDEVGFGPRQLGWPAHERMHAVASALESVGLEALAGRHPRDLSGGERERVAVAAALVSRPRVLVLDEPTRGMDDETSTRLVGLLHAHAAEGNASLLLTHDLELARRAADRRLTLVGGAPC
jgi:energy-coupling factor transport system ATP-binding protein